MDISSAKRNANSEKMMKKRGGKVEDGQEIKVKRTVKDSVFSDLFRNKKYLLELYHTLHPEDTEATEDTLTDITIENVLTDNLYNDLGFVAGERMMILVEAQSTWTVNILIRTLMYLAESYHGYFERTNQNLYRSKKIKMPKPELYVIYTGNRGNRPDMISLSKEFFESADIDLEVKAKVIYESEKNDIISQYIVFCKVFGEQKKKYGMTREAITETIRICKDRNVLREYLGSREREVVTIMMSLFDEEQIMKSFIRSERYEAAQEATRETARATAEQMIRDGEFSIEKIAKYVPALSLDELKEMEAKIMQMA